MEDTNYDFRKLPLYADDGYRSNEFSAVLWQFIPGLKGMRVASMETIAELWQVPPAMVFEVHGFGYSDIRMVFDRLTNGLMAAGYSAASSSWTDGSDNSSWYRVSVGAVVETGRDPVILPWTDNIPFTVLRGPRPIHPIVLRTKFSGSPYYSGRYRHGD